MKHTTNIPDSEKSKDELVWELKKLRQQHELALKAKDQELKQLNKVLDTVNATLDLDQVMRNAMEALQDIFSFNQVSIYLFNSENNTLEVNYWYGDQISETLTTRFRQFPLSIEWDEVYFIKAFLDNETLYVSPISEKTMKFYSPRDQQMFEWNPHKSILIVPLNVQEKVFGVINFVNTQAPFCLNEQDIEQIERYVAQIASTINNAYLVKKTQKALEKAQAKEKEIDHLNKVIQATNTSLDIDTVFDAILNGLKDVFDFEAIGIQLIDRHNKLLNIFKVYGDMIEEHHIQQWRAIQIASEGAPSVSSYVYAKGEMALFADISPDMPFAEIDRKIFNVMAFRGYLAFPLKVGSEKIGVISFFRPHLPFDLNDKKIEQIERYVATLSNVIRNSKTYHELQNAYFRMNSLLEASLKLYRLKSIQEIAEFTVEKVIWAFPNICLSMIFETQLDQQKLIIPHNMPEREQALFIARFSDLIKSRDKATDETFVSELNLISTNNPNPTNRKESWKIFTLVSTEKLVLGKLILKGINMKEQNEYTLTLFIHQITSALENRVLVNALNQHSQH
jgi:GAF domain-containing protein